jgi:hypothetical protein
MAELNITYPDLARSALAGSQVASAQSENAIRQMALQKQEGLRNALSGVSNLEDVYNRAGDVMSVAPELGIQLMAQKRLQAGEDRKLREEGVKYAASAVAPLLDMDDQTAAQIYPKVKSDVLSQYPMLSQYAPAQWDRSVMTQLAGMAVSPDKRFDVANRAPIFHDITVGDDSKQTAVYTPTGGLKPLGAPTKTGVGSGKETPFVQFRKGLNEKTMREEGRLATEEEVTNKWNENQIAFSAGRAEATAKGRNIGNLDPKAIEFASNQILAGNSMPMGRGVQMISAVYAAAQDKLDAMGGSPGQVVAAKQFASGLAESQKKQQVSLGAMGSFVRNINKQVDRADEIMGDVIQRVGTRALDVPWRRWNTEFVGSGHEKALEAYLNEISAEISKLSSGSQASIAQLPVETQAIWNKIHDPNLSYKELKYVLDETKNMAQMRQESAKEELSYTQSQINEVGKKYGLAATPQSKPTVTQQAQGKIIAKTGTDSQGRKVVVYTDGSWEYGK